MGQSLLAFTAAMAAMMSVVIISTVRVGHKQRHRVPRH
jgi:hypothetical protein